MRRKDREVQERSLIDQIMAKAQVCRLGLCKDNQPYVVPVSFGYDGSYIYFHTAQEGMKLDYLAANNRVCFEMEHDVMVVPGAVACAWSFSYYSVIGFGTVEEVVDHQGKAHALSQIVKHYSGRDWDLSDRSLEKTRTWRISIEQITGKRTKDKTTF